MKNQFLEAGQIVNTHGIQGEVKIVPWCDTPEFLCQFDTLYLDGRPVKVLARRVHKGNVLAKLEGVSDVNAAMVLKGKTAPKAPTYQAEEKSEGKYVCKICGYVYSGDVPFEELPDSWVCPVCGAPKSQFEKK